MEATCNECGRPAEVVSAHTGASYCAACAAWIFSGREKPQENDEATA